MKIAIIIPAYNEGEVIEDVVKSLPKKILEIKDIISVVVDDGSLDDTYAKAKKQADYVLKHSVNMGVGAATKTGLEAAKKLNCDIAVTIDGDGQHCPDDIENLVKQILEKKADITLGARINDRDKMPAIKRFGNWMMNFLTFLVFYHWVSDSQSGMKALSRNALHAIKIDSIGYEVCSEMIGEARANNLKLIEVPIKTIYTDYSKAKGQNIFNAVNILTKIISIKTHKRK